MAEATVEDTSEDMVEDTVDVGEKRRREEDMLCQMIAIAAAMRVEQR